VAITSRAVRSISTRRPGRSARICCAILGFQTEGTKLSTLPQPMNSPLDRPLRTSSSTERSWFTGSTTMGFLPGMYRVTSRAASGARGSIGGRVPETIQGGLQAPAEIRVREHRAGEWLPATGQAAAIITAATDRQNARAATRMRREIPSGEPGSCSATAPR